MSVALVLSALRQEIGRNIGEPGPVTGTFTTQPGTGTTAIDNTRYEQSGAWNGGEIQDTAISGGSIVIVQSWDQTSQTFALLRAFSSSAGLDAYEVHVRLSFAELRAAVNRGIALCGQSLRTLVRDETQALVANTYQYVPNYGSGSNRFYPQGVVRIEFEYWTGQPTRQFIEIPYGEDGWHYLDDETIQLPQNYVDSYATDTLRFTGYGPVSAYVTSDNPTLAIATFDDDFQTLMLVHACSYYAWRLIAAKLSAGEQSAAMGNAQLAMQDFQMAQKDWARRPIITRGVLLPSTGSGWRGS